MELSVFSGGAHVACQAHAGKRQRTAGASQRSPGYQGSNARLTDPNVPHAARHLALLMSAPGTQNARIWTAREQIGIEPAPAQIGGSVRVLSRFLCQRRRFR